MPCYYRMVVKVVASHLTNSDTIQEGRGKGASLLLGGGGSPSSHKAFRGGGAFIITEEE